MKGRRVGKFSALVVGAVVVALLGGALPASAASKGAAKKALKLSSISIAASQSGVEASTALRNALFDPSLGQAATQLLSDDAVDLTPFERDMLSLAVLFGTASNRALLSDAFAGRPLSTSQTRAYNTLRKSVRRDPAIKVLIAEGKELRRDTSRIATVFADIAASPSTPYPDSVTFGVEPYDAVEDVFQNAAATPSVISVANAVKDTMRNPVAAQVAKTMKPLDAAMFLSPAELEQLELPAGSTRLAAAFASFGTVTQPPTPADFFSVFLIKTTNFIASGLLTGLVISTLLPVLGAPTSVAVVAAVAANKLHDLWQVGEFWYETYELHEAYQRDVCQFSPASCPPVVTTSGVTGVEGIPFGATATLQAAGGTLPYTWALDPSPLGQPLPPDLHLESDGRITGAGASPGTTTIHVLVTDNEGRTGSGYVTITIEPQVTPVITKADFATGGVELTFVPPQPLPGEVISDYLWEASCDLESIPWSGTLGSTDTQALAGIDGCGTTDQVRFYRLTPVSNIPGRGPSPWKPVNTIGAPTLDGSFDGWPGGGVTLTASVPLVPGADQEVSAYAWQMSLCDGNPVSVFGGMSFGSGPIHASSCLAGTFNTFYLYAFINGTWATPYSNEASVFIPPPPQNP
jgi:hypothetical protein